VALAGDKVTFDIPAQAAPGAIRTWATQSGLQVFAADEHLLGVRTNAVRGDYTAIEAAQKLIAGTGLEVVAAGENAVTIRRASGGAAASERPFMVQQTLALREDRAAPPAETAPAETEENVVTVTGSRIKRAGYDTLQPAIVTDAEELELRGYLNVAQALEATPGFGTGVNATGGQATFGAGQTFVNFFGLGSNRTLTLVNGRRFVSSNTVAGGNAGSQAGSGLQVDLNVIPAGLVSRIETVAIGGAPIYGADAIAGTVNVMLKDDFEGIQSSAQFGVTSEGDGETKSFRTMMGGNFSQDRGNAVLGFEYNEQEGMLVSDRFTYYRLLPNPANTGPNDGIPAQRVVSGYGFGAITEGGLPYITAGVAPGFTHPTLFPNGNYIFDGAGAPLKFGPNGDLVPLALGTVLSSSSGIPIEVSGGDRLDPARHGSLLAPSKRILLNGIAHYDLAPGVRAFVETAYANTEGTELSELAAFAAPTLTGTAVTLSVDNAFLGAQARDTLLANGVTGDFSMARNFSDVVDRRPSHTEIDLQRFVGGLQGDFIAFGERYSWDVSYNYGRSKAVSTLAYINDTRFVEAVNAVMDAGRIVCSSGNVACVPLNLFGEGAASMAAVDYVLDRGVGTSTNTQRVGTANFGGNLPFGVAGPVAFNVGAEYRREEGSFVVDGTLRAGAFLLGAPLAGAYVGTEGSYFTREVYTEVVAPMVADEWDVPGIRMLTLEGALRYVDNSLTGADTTWSAGLRLMPRLPGWGDGLLLRGVFTQAIRAPSITELFSGQTPTQGTISDPCSALNYNQGPNPSVREANCAAALAAVGAPPPGAFMQTTNTTAVRGFTQGNSSLQNEEADSWSVGFVYEPSVLPNFGMSLDWINISLQQGISVLGIGTLLTQCYDNAGLGNPACAAFSRLTPAEAAASLVPRVAGDVANGYSAGFFNTSEREFSGAIFDARYRAAMRGTQALRVGGRMFYTSEDATVAFVGQDSVDAAGLAGTPEYRVQFNLGYSFDRLDLDWQTLWTDSVLLSRTATIEQSPILSIPSYTLSNATVGYRLRDEIRVQVGVNNVFDEEPAFEALVALAFRQYNPIGRSYFATVRASF
jgi:outer membrane receptor protein involved in Fe transport